MKDIGRLPASDILHNCRRSGQVASKSPSCARPVIKEAEGGSILDDARHSGVSHESPMPHRSDTPDNGQAASSLSLQKTSRPLNRHLALSLRVEPSVPPKRILVARPSSADQTRPFPSDLPNDRSGQEPPFALKKLPDGYRPLPVVQSGRARSRNRPLEPRTKLPDARKLRIITRSGGSMSKATDYLSVMLMVPSTIIGERGR